MKYHPEVISNRIHHAMRMCSLRYTEDSLMINAASIRGCYLEGLQQQIQIKLGWALFVTYTIIQSIMRSEMCSLHLTHPSVHIWSSGQPTVQRPGSSRGLPVGAGIRTHNLGLPRVSSPTLYPLGQRLPKPTGFTVVLGKGSTREKGRTRMVRSPLLYFTLRYSRPPSPPLMVHSTL